MDPQEGDIADLPDGRTAVRQGGRWVVQGASPQGGQAQPPIQGFVPFETPQQRVQAEERAYDRQRDTVRDGQTAAREERAIEAAQRSADTAERTAAKLTEDQGKSGGYAQLMADAEQSYQQALREGFNPTGFGAGLANFTDNIPLMGGVGNFIRNDAGDRARQAELQWTDAQLKAMSGAASPEQEVTRNQITFFARPGQNFGYLGERLEEARQVAFESAKRRAGQDLQGLVYPETDPAAPAQVRPGTDAASAINYRDESSREALAAIMAEGGWVRDGDGEPYYVGPGGIQMAAPQEGDEQTAPGVRMRPQEAGSGQAGMVLGGQMAFQRAAIEQVPFAEKAFAGVTALATGNSYSDIRRAQAALRESDRENQGTARNLGGVAGVAAQIPVGGPAGRFVASAPRMGVSMVRGAGVGTGAGALYGAGTTQGESLGEMATGARNGAMVGALTGGVGIPVARGVGMMTNSLTRPIREGVGDLISRFGGNPMTADDRAVRTMMRGVDPNQAAAQLAEGRRYGADLTAADVGGSNVQSRVRVAATRQTPGRQAAQDFSSGRRSEVQDFAAGLGERVSPVARSPQQLDEALETYQRQASAPAFAAARADPPVTLPPDISQALYGDEGRSAMTQAARLYRSSPDPDEQAIGAEIEQLAARTIQPGESVEVSVGVADLISRYLQRAGGQDRNAQRIFGSLGTSVRESARSQSGAYDDALTDYASRARLGDAVETGERFLGKGYTGDFVEAAGGMDDAQRNIARAAARAGIERASETGGSAPGLLDKLATGRGQQQRSVALLGPEGAADIRQGAQVGRRMVDAGNNVNPRAGSNTYLNASDDNAQAVGGIVGNIAQGRFGSAIGGAIDMMRSRGISDEQAELIVRLGTDPSRTDDVLRILQTRFPDQEARQILAQLTPAISSQTGGAAAPQPQPRLMTGTRP